jgi:hypothetical protein
MKSSRPRCDDLICEPARIAEYGASEWLGSR